MFFILSKILHYILAPLVWIMALLIISIIIKNNSRKRKLRIIAFILLILFTNPFIQDEFMRSWEINAVQISELKENYDYGIVLTGMITYDSKYERINFLRSADRIFQTLDLYKRGIITKIFITGGSGLLFDQENKEAILLKDYLIHIGIPEEDILIESESKNTYENALETAKILKPEENNDTYLLITSAFHMRRAAGCFKKQGFKFDQFVTDRYAGNRKYELHHLIVPKAGALQRWTILVREVSGFIIYKIVGYR